MMDENTYFGILDRVIGRAFPTKGVSPRATAPDSELWADLTIDDCLSPEVAIQAAVNLLLRNLSERYPAASYVWGAAKPPKGIEGKMIGPCRIVFDKYECTGENVLRIGVGVYALEAVAA